jgi:cyanate permease
MLPTVLVMSTRMSMSMFWVSMCGIWKKLNRGMVVRMFICSLLTVCCLSWLNRMVKSAKKNKTLSDFHIVKLVLCDCPWQTSRLNVILTHVYLVLLSWIILPCHSSVLSSSTAVNFAAKTESWKVFTFTWTYFPYWHTCIWFVHVRRKKKTCFKV